MELKKFAAPVRRSIHNMVMRGARTLVCVCDCVCVCTALCIECSVGNCCCSKLNQNHRALSRCGRKQPTVRCWAVHRRDSVWFFLSQRNSRATVCVVKHVNCRSATRSEQRETHEHDRPVRVARIDCDRTRTDRLIHQCRQTRNCDTIAIACMQALLLVGPSNDARRVGVRLSNKLVPSGIYHVCARVRWGFAMVGRMCCTGLLPPPSPSFPRTIQHVHFCCGWCCSRLKPFRPPGEMNAIRKRQIRWRAQVMRRVDAE